VESADCFVPSANEYVNWNDSTPDRSEAFEKYRYEGPVYVGVDIADIAGSEVRYSLYDSTTDCKSPVNESQHICYRTSGLDFIVHRSRAFHYNGKTRIVIYSLSFSSPRTDGWNHADVDVNYECSKLKVWTCRTALSEPSDISFLNITDALYKIQKYDITQNTYDLDKPVGPLEPGPMVNMNFAVNKELSKVESDLLRLQLCQAVWNISDDPEMCNWQIWVDIEVGSNIEIWSDDDPPSWQSYDNILSTNTNIWTVSVTVLMESNSNAARARYLLTKKVNADDFIQAYKVLRANVTVSGDSGALPSGALTNNFAYFAHVTAPWPAMKRDERSIYGCATHYECADGLFCSLYAINTWDKTNVGYGYGCDSCKTCLDSEMYAIDGSCPQDKCGPRAGTYPKCWDAKKIFSTYACSDKYALNLSSVQSNSDIKTQTEPTEKTLRARFLTPFNRLVGALVVKQKRLKVLDYINPNSSSKVCNFKNDSFSRYSRTADPSRGLICLDRVGQDSGFFGIDPVFAAVSTLYDGKLNPLDFYNKTEFATSASPYGFFPHSYDGQKGRVKPLEEVFPEIADYFLLFFDEHITNVRASKMITYLKDGNFIDEQTSEIKVEMSTINARSNILCRIVFTFKWQVA
jgi:hypothetical protein